MKKKGKQNRTWENSGTSRDSKNLDYSRPATETGQNVEMNGENIDDHDRVRKKSVNHHGAVQCIYNV